MTANRLYFGAFVIFLGLVLAGLFSQSASAFSREELASLNRTVRLNLAGDAPGTFDPFRPKEFDFRIGADQKYGQQFHPDTFYSRNMDLQANPVEIGGIKLRF